MKNKLKENYIVISSIAFPIITLALIYLITTISKRPTENQSTYRQAIKHFESKETSPTSTILSSNLFQGRIDVEDTTDYSSISNIEIFNDKLSLPQEQLSYLLEDLEQEHKKILKGLEYSETPHSQTLDLDLRYRIVLATFLGKTSGELNDNDLQNLVLSPEEEYFLKKLSQSNDFKLLLEKERLTQRYVRLENLKSIYGTDEELTRSISSEEI